MREIDAKLLSYVVGGMSFGVAAYVTTASSTDWLLSLRRYSRDYPSLLWPVS